MLLDAGEAEAFRKVAATNKLDLTQNPTNLDIFGIRYTVDAYNGSLSVSDGQDAALAHIRDRRDMQVSLLLGRGFYTWMSKPQPHGVTEQLSQLSIGSRIRPLPSVDLLNTGDEILTRAIVAEALPADRGRFQVYLKNRPLGLALIAAASRSIVPNCIICANIILGTWYRQDDLHFRRSCGYAVDSGSRPRLDSNKCRNGQLCAENQRASQSHRAAMPRAATCQYQGLLSVARRSGTQCQMRGPGSARAATRPESW